MQVVAKVLLIGKTTCLFTPLSQVVTLLRLNGHLYDSTHLVGVKMI